MSDVARLHVRVTPGSAPARVVGRRGEAWKVRVGAAAEHGRANAELIALLAAALALPRRQVEIVAGHGSADKTLRLHGLGRAEIEPRLGLAAGAA
jgi:uncharacterized protein (TIGR00251 family)